MADTIVMDRKSFVDREMFLRMKQDQKDTALFLKGKLSSLALGQPEEDRKRANRLSSSTHARYLNIVYGIVHGRKYREIEHKYRENNAPDGYWIEKVCAEYGINYSTTYAEFLEHAEIDYGV
jgi:hypothetical protein